MKKTIRKPVKPAIAASKAVKSNKPRLALPDQHQSAPVAVVGIGASAGGLEAFKQLLVALPADTGMAFVFVQHLEARHESMLTSILANVTAMPVSEAAQGTPVRANHVYVIPPNADIHIANGLLQISSRKAPLGKHLPIDSFFRSLAEQQGAAAIGVILSGTASDGTLGLKAIKVEGGITFAQEPETAKFDGMPTSAIAAGCVDFVLPPKRIATELAQISRHPYVRIPHFDDAIPALTARDEEWLRAFKLLKNRSGVDFTFYKKATIKRRIARRMALKKIEHLAAYVAFLETNREELDALYQDILIHVTSFFREPEVFRAFESKILPAILKGKPEEVSVRCWVAGCSTGEEVYSLAMCLLDTLGDDLNSAPIQIFGTDVSEQAIDKARAGIYPVAGLAHVPPERLRRYFTKANGHYQINSNVRDLCVFARHDLTKDPPFSRLDIVSCRNVLIYLEPVLQKRVLSSFHYALKDTGFLLLGKSETLSGYPELFSITDRKNKFFTRKAGSGNRYDAGTAIYERLLPREKTRAEALPSFDPEKEADRAVWERYAHAGLVVDKELQILHFRGDTSAYLRPAPGKASLQLLRMLRDELVLEVRAAVHKARRTGTLVRREGIQMNRNGAAREIVVEVSPLPSPRASEKYFLILFEEPGTTDQQPAAVRQAGGAKDRDIHKLTSELARTREYLQAIIQEQESTNEELKTANEEALSSMEELQSANEELETAKEELQSSNEELVTLNEQLQNRNTELGHLSDDLTNVLNSVIIPIVMLDGEHRIRRVTPSAEKLLHLLPGDIGRPIGDIRLGLPVPELDEMLSLVIERGTELQRELHAESGRWYSLRLTPYRSGRKTDGVLLAFVDVDELKRSQEAVRKEGSLVSAILDAAHDLLVVVLDRDGRIVRFNRACQNLTGYSLDEVQNRRLWDFLLLPSDVADVKATLHAVLAGISNRRENYWITKEGQYRLIAWSNSVATSNGSVEYVIATGIDVTERQEAREQVVEQEATVQALLESAAQAILAITSRGRIVFVNASAVSMFGYSRPELLALPIADLLPETLRQSNTEHQDHWFSCPQNRLMGTPLDLEGRRKDGSQFPVEISLSSIETKDGALSVTFVSDITERKKGEAEVLRYQQELRSLNATLLHIQEADTRSLSRELHDDLSQKLAALSMEASALLRPSSDPDEMLPQRVRDLARRIGDLAKDVHRLSRRLHPAILDDLGLEAALREECLTCAEHLGVPVQFTAREVPRSIPADVALCVFRVAQESLRNIAKHAMAKSVRLHLMMLDSDLVLAVEDNGVGFDLNEVRGRGGLGLISMEERVRLVGGVFAIHSKPEDGTAIEAHVPIKETSV